MIATTDNRPGWAQGLPPHAELAYLQTLLAVGGMLLVASWLAFRVVRDPASIARIGRKAIG